MRIGLCILGCTATTVGATGSRLVVSSSDTSANNVVTYEGTSGGVNTTWNTAYSAHTVTAGAAAWRVKLRAVAAQPPSSDVNGPPNVYQMVIGIAASTDATDDYAFKHGGVPNAFGYMMVSARI